MCTTEDSKDIGSSTMNLTINNTFHGISVVHLQINQQQYKMQI
jgi:hypothetical protein